MPKCSLPAPPGSRRPGARTDDHRPRRHYISPEGPCIGGIRLCGGTSRRSQERKPSRLFRRTRERKHPRLLPDDPLGHPPPPGGHLGIGRGGKTLGQGSAPLGPQNHCGDPGEPGLRRQDLHRPFPCQGSGLLQRSPFRGLFMGVRPVSRRRGAIRQASFVLRPERAGHGVRARPGAGGVTLQLQVPPFSGNGVGGRPFPRGSPPEGCRSFFRRNQA